MCQGNNRHRSVANVSEWLPSHREQALFLLSIDSDECAACVSEQVSIKSKKGESERKLSISGGKYAKRQKMQKKTAATTAKNESKS